MKKKTVIPVLVTVIISAAVFTLCGILLLPAQIGSAPSPAGDAVSGISYYSEAENCGILCLYEDGSGGLVFLDFDAGCMNISLYDEDPVKNAMAEGYDIGYTINVTADFLCRLCDRLGGIVMTEGGEERRYFSVGLSEKLADMDDRNSKVEIAEAFFRKIAKIGLSSDDFMFIIEETKNDLAYPVCYHWIQHMSELSENYIFS